MVERRLEELVLQHEPLRVAEPRVDPGERVVQAVLTRAHVVLAGVVGALGEPDLQIARAGRIHDVDAGEVVVDRLASDAVVVVGERAELVVLVLERVRVDGAQRHAEVFGVTAQRRVVVDRVPRDVQRHGRGERRVAVHLGGVGDLLERVAGRAGSGEDPEAGAGVAERPRGQFDPLGLERGQVLG